MMPHVQQVHIQNALRVNGAFVRLSPEDFQNLLNRSEDLIVVTSKTGIFNNTYLFLTSYKGLIFYCKNKEQISIPSKHEKLHSESITLPIH